MSCCNFSVVIFMPSILFASATDLFWSSAAVWFSMHNAGRQEDFWVIGMGLLRQCIM
jgi:hypothetical protein